MIIGIVAGAPVSGAPAFPNLLSRTTTPVPASGTNHLITMPATVNAGDLLIVEFASFGSSAVTTPAGWNLISSLNDAGSIRSSTYWKSADGSEGGTTVNFVTVNSVNGCAIVSRIQAGTWSGTPERTAVAAGVSTVNPNPPNHTASWGAMNTLWLATFCGDNGGAGETISVYPYPDDNIKVVAGSGTFAATTAGCSVESATASLNPGTFTRSQTGRAVSSTVAIRPV